MKTTNFHFISDAKSEQRKLRRKGFRTRLVITGTPYYGYGAYIEYH
jgi:hypothetical protein